MDTPENIPSHTFHFIQRAIREGKLHRPRYWEQDGVVGNRLLVTMPDTSTNLQVTRESPEGRVYAFSGQQGTPQELLTHLQTIRNNDQNVAVSSPSWAERTAVVHSNTSLLDR